MKGDELVNRVTSRRFSRRGFLSAAALAGVGAAGLALVGCGKKKKAEKPAAAAKPAEEKPAAQPPAQEKPAAAPAAAPAAVITVTLSDFKVEVKPASTPAGDLTFSVTNNGPTGHEFVILRTDLRPDALPLTADGTQADVEGRGVTLVDRIDEIPAGTTVEKTVNLKKGRHVLICNLPGHYQLGMRAEFEAAAVVTNR